MSLWRGRHLLAAWERVQLDVRDVVLEVGVAVLLLDVGVAVALIEVNRLLWERQGGE